MYRIFFLISFLIFSSCEKDKTNLIINFTHTVDNVPVLSCCTEDEALPYTNLAGERYNVQRLQYLISNITLHDSNGGSKIIKDIHFLDLFEDIGISINAEELDNLEYTAISFTMGLENSINTSTLHINKDWHPIMTWPELIGGGYHYMKLEGDFDTITQGYSTHTGALKMINQTMRMDHSFIVDLPIENYNNSDNLSININMEINNWYQTPNQINFSKYYSVMDGDTISGIMMNMEKQIKLQANGSTDVFSIHINK